MPAHIKYTESDIKGVQFGRLTGLTIYQVPRTDIPVGWKRQAVLVCSCGNLISANIADVMNGKYKSCGCLRTERIKALSGMQWKEYKQNKELLNEQTNQLR